jgi:hypothetical protein
MTCPCKRVWHSCFGSGPTLSALLAPLAACVCILTAAGACSLL